MAKDAGWFIHSIKSNNGHTVGSSIPDATISTDGTGAGGSLQVGETFKVGTTTFTYDGTATVGKVGGFYANAGNSQFFFSKQDVGNKLVHFGSGDTVICFYPGTLIRTPQGDVPVERLAIGDLVITAVGTTEPVRWLGRQTVSTLFADPLRVLPIRIKAGALAEHLPVRDLLVSPDHAILVQDVLVQAGALVNGTSICRADEVPPIFTYYHVELANHALVLAEGVPAETFVDNAGRLAFDNWAEHEALDGTDTPIPEMALPRAKSHRQVPVAVRQHLALRAAALPGAVNVAA